MYSDFKAMNYQALCPCFCVSQSSKKETNWLILSKIFMNWHHKPQVKSFTLLNEHDLEECPILLLKIWGSFIFWCMDGVHSVILKVHLRTVLKIHYNCLFNRVFLDIPLYQSRMRVSYSPQRIKGNLSSPEEVFAS